jgi:hypothetical protein
MTPRARRTILTACVLGVVALVLDVAINYAEAPSPPPCCPQCGCREGLVPVCHTYWTTKKETKYHYCCQCEPICVPDQPPCCTKLLSDKNCADGSCSDDVGNCEHGKCNCLIVAQHKLVKFPYTVETPVCKCKIDWVCPHCGCNCTAENELSPPADTSTPISSPTALPASATLTQQATYGINTAFEEVPGMAANSTEAAPVSLK